ncbi:MAG: antitoxin [Deltaproteobacteria bacterium]|nr:antitoxin [Deltaproteobacteria bacterium]
MALSIKHDEADRMARELAKLTGESLTQAIVVALRERLQRQRAKKDNRPLHEQIMEIGRRFSARPVLDDRTDDEILGYDEHGLPS